MQRVHLVDFSVPWRLLRLISSCPIFVSALLGDLIGTASSAEFWENAPIAEINEMHQDQVYQGRNIRLSATHNADGTWTGMAHFPDDPARTLTTEATFRSQSEALSAALSRAMSEIDRERMSRGKP